MARSLAPKDLLVQVNTFKRNPLSLETIFGPPQKINKIFIPAGEFELTDGLILETPAIICGEGPGISKLIYNGSGPALTFLLQNGNRSGIRDLTITTTNPQTDTCGVFVSETDHFFLDNVEINGFNGSNSCGLSFGNNCTNASINNVSIKGNKKGIEIISSKNCSLNNVSLENTEGNLHISNCNNISWNNGSNQGTPSSFGIKIEDGYSVSINNIDNSINTAFAIETAGTKNESISISNCSFKKSDSARKLIKLRNVTQGSCRNLRTDLKSGDIGLETEGSNNIAIDHQNEIFQGSNYIVNNDSSGIIWSTGRSEGVNKNLNLPSHIDVLDVTKDLVALGFSKNVVKNVIGGGDAIQDAVNYYIDNPGAYSAIYLPPGLYLTTKPLFFCKPNGFAASVVLISKLSAFPMAPPSGGATIRFVGDGSGNEKLLPAFVIQAARAHYYRGINFESQGNLKPYQLLQAGPGHSALYKSKEEWISDGVRTNASSPQCVFAVDPFIPADPLGDSNNCYPGWRKYYGNPNNEAGGWTNPGGSSAIIWEFCSFQGGYIGTAVSPPGAGPNGIDLVANAENFLWETCFWTYNAVSFSQGQSQSRANEMRSPKMYGAWIHIDSEHCGPGGNAGQIPAITGAPNLGACRYLFNAFGTGQTVVVTNLYCESTLSIGKINTGYAGTSAGGTFRGCSFSFVEQTGARAPNEPSVPFHIQSWGFTTFDKCLFATESGPLKFWNAGPQIFRECQFIQPGGSINDSVQVGWGLNNQNYIQITNAHTYHPNIGAVYEKDPVPTFTEVSVDSGNIITITQDSTISHKGTATLLSVSGLKVGDVLHLASNTPTQFKPETLFSTQHPYALSGPIGRISSISGNTITIDYISKGFPFSQPVRLKVTRWDNSS